jgi:Tol biopolymer transport system component
MTRKRWITVVVAALLVCLVTAGFGAVWLVRNIPGAARLVYGNPRSPTPFSSSPGTLPFLPTVTLTPEPTRAQPSATPSATLSVQVTPRVTRVGTPTAGALATLTATAFLTTTPTLTPTLSLPTPTPRPQWIAFETTRGAFGDYEIFVMASDGSRLANLSNSWADDVAPVWAPDGRRIAFVSFRDTLTGKWGVENGSIYIMDFDPVAGTGTGNAVRLTDGQGSDGWPTWSPDGKRIAFHSNRGGDWDIWIINTDGSGLTNLTASPGEDRYPAWSPGSVGSAQIAFMSRRGGDQDVWVINVDGSDPKNLTKKKGRDRYPMWSPDGKRLTFNTNRDGDQEVYMMNADGSNQTNVSRSPKSTEGLADWSPNGRQLVLYSDRPGNKDIFIVDLSTGRWTDITNNPASDEFCTWSPYGGTN